MVQRGVGLALNLLSLEVRGSITTRSDYYTNPKDVFHRVRENGEFRNSLHNNTDRNRTSIKMCDYN